MGSYHGKKSFETFSHCRSCLVRPLLNDESLKTRYPPSLAKVRGGVEAVREARLLGAPGPHRTRAFLPPCVLFTDDPSLRCTWPLRATPLPLSGPRRIVPGPPLCSSVDQRMSPLPSGPWASLPQVPAPLLDIEKTNKSSSAGQMCACACFLCRTPPILSSPIHTPTPASSYPDSQ